jgi:hypothetical protein
LTWCQDSSSSLLPPLWDCLSLSKSSSTSTTSKIRTTTTV